MEVFFFHFFTFALHFKTCGLAKELSHSWAIPHLYLHAFPSAPLTPLAVRRMVTTGDIVTPHFLGKAFPPQWCDCDVSLFAQSHKSNTADFLLYFVSSLFPLVSFTSYQMLISFYATGACSFFTPVGNVVHLPIFPLKLCLILNFKSVPWGWWVNGTVERVW